MKIDLSKMLKNPRANAYRNVVLALNNAVTQLESVPDRTGEDEQCYWLLRFMRTYYEIRLMWELKPKKLWRK